MYTIESISEEGAYYLSSNWRKNSALWVTKINFKERMFFKTIAGAKRSLTSLLKTMPEYTEDKFAIVDEKFNKIENI